MHCNENVQQLSMFADGMEIEGPRCLYLLADGRQWSSWDPVRQSRRYSDLGGYIWQQTREGLDGLDDQSYVHHIRWSNKSSYITCREWLLFFAQDAVYGSWSIRDEDLAVRLAFVDSRDLIASLSIFLTMYSFCEHLPRTFQISNKTTSWVLIFENMLKHPCSHIWSGHVPQLHICMHSSERSTLAQILTSVFHKLAGRLVTLNFFTFS